MTYLTTTFSPSMLPANSEAIVKELTEDKPRQLLKQGFTSAVGHENTAAILSRLFGTPVQFNRVNLTLQNGDVLLAAVPQIRFTEAREYSDDEVTSASFRFFAVKLVDVISITSYIFDHLWF